jgi:hypothetical protein
MIDRMPFAKAFFPKKKSLLCINLWATPMLIPRNPGFGTLYGLWRSPYHWYDKINSILFSIGLRSSFENPCLYSGFIKDPSNPSSLPSQHPLCLGLNVDNFVYFSEDLEVESLFCCRLVKQCKVDFIGIVDWFLGIQFL